MPACRPPGVRGRTALPARARPREPGADALHDLVSPEVGRGDKRDVLALKKVGKARIITARRFLTILQK